ncbi:MAG: DNA translocase FtsK [Candidatus Hydrogenedentes bacterium]|nr:DNA translocase FtsK [Candidatus Hydrogenedentota bacterium]
MSGMPYSSRERTNEIVGIAMIALTILLFLALITDGYKSDVRRPLEGMAQVSNLLGKPGAIVAGIGSIAFGGAVHLLYFLTLVWGSMLLRHQGLDRLLWRAGGAVVMLFSVSALLHIDVTPTPSGDHAGGVIGGFLGSFLLNAFGDIGSNIIAAALFVIGLLLATEFLFVHAFDAIRIVVMAVAKFATATIAAFVNAVTGGAKSAWANRRALNKDDKSKATKSKAEKIPSQPRVESPAPIVLARFANNDNEKRDEPLAAKTGKKLPAKQAAIVESEEQEDTTTTEQAEEKRIRIWTSQSTPDLDDDDDEDLIYGEDDGEEEAEADLDEATEDETEESDAAIIGIADEAKPTITQPVRAPIEFTALKKRAPMPRRKTAIDAELPADYVYPKRYTKPSLELFDMPTPPPVEDWSDELLKTSQILEETLQTFSIEARVTDVTRGPTITRFELEPAPGIKVSRFLSLADDIALALKAHRVRVEAPIPGKGRVGIEVPNKFREPVVIRELLESRPFSRSKGPLPLTLGKDIAGEVSVADLTGMPHVLVAGATGAGKTVCVKTLLASLLVARTPDELQLMLIDPKMVELSIFDDIPHLITPVVTDAKKAASALQWLITEMEERYRLFAHLRVRNIEVYNQSVDNGEIELVSEGGDDQTEQNSEAVQSIRKLPYIVCVIDELADLMMLARAEVEDAIARLAQLARAVGIHLVIATQRPSVDVLTGVIKANFPCRISFQVSSRVDSRCILDEIGAERLIGKGDMLYLPAGQSKPTRIQGAFVSDQEMNGLIAYLKTQAPPQYRDEIQNFGKSKDQLEIMEDEDDEKFDEAVQVVLETGQASISMVQRRLRVGYTRAARLIDMMEMRGIVGPHIGSKAREILVSMPPNNEVA